MAKWKEISPTPSLEAMTKRIEELEAENKRLRLEVHHANDVADAAIEGAKELKAKLAKAVEMLDRLSFARTTIAELKGDDPE